VLQHPLKGLAPPTSSDSKNTALNLSSAESSEERFQHPLGNVPHQLRGFLSSFSNLSISGKPYDCCSACSDKIVERYRKDGWEFVKKAINEKGWVEEISGLAEVQRRAEAAMEAEDWSEAEGDDDGDGELI